MLCHSPMSRTAPLLPNSLVWTGGRPPAPAASALAVPALVGVPLAAAAAPPPLAAATTAPLASARGAHTQKYSKCRKPLGHTTDRCFQKQWDEGRRNNTSGGSGSNDSGSGGDGSGAIGGSKRAKKSSGNN